MFCGYPFWGCFEVKPGAQAGSGNVARVRARRRNRVGSFRGLLSFPGLLVGKDGLVTNSGSKLLVGSFWAPLRK